MKNRGNLPKVWNAFGYTRISKDDRDKTADLDAESNSIKSQRDLILDFVGRNPDIISIQIAADEGATGANFDRDAFKDMIAHIESGAVNCVVVKDFSRLGRDHIEAGKYIERYFAQMNVRFISINDNYDSLFADMNDSSNSLIVPFKNIINEAFLEDISIKTKTQLAIKRKKGEFVGSFATYGYVKTPDKKLVVDEFAAEIVRSIYGNKLEGFNNQQIAQRLNDLGVLSPAEHKKASGEAYSTPFAVNEKSLWTAKAIERILTNRVYIGHLEQGKRVKVSYRVKKSLYQPREAWSIHEDNHEPIVSKHDFELVQELLKKDTRVSTNTGQLHLFSGIAMCGLCKQALTVKRTKKSCGKIYHYYVCSTYRRDKSCKNISINSVAIEEHTLQSVKKQIESFLDADDFTAEMGLEEHKARKKNALEGMVEKSLQSIAQYNDYLVKSYAHMIDGVVSEQEYNMFKNDFQNKITNAENHIANLRIEISNLQNDTKNLEIIEHFKLHKSITSLDRRIVVGFVHSVIAYSNKELEIRLRYRDEFAEVV